MSPNASLSGGCPSKYACHIVCAVLDCGLMSAGDKYEAQIL